ncbi:DUF320 domain-containing protein [Microbacterium saccharophilum]|uniref:DUF320 domain-containing protein n=1 Tax=Microbacterium saccharophilum TaxID=1213358 RepID=A0A5C8I8S5_9MICO|nr:chaplin family protein [Microbacterium saccharophilum]TXK15059.1 DUF320 domain-containing protein [Microbacterium saccharophilum]GEP47466.1 hypothetical protein MSA03_09740 [Microbacterium saccharophilum]
MNINVTRALWGTLLAGGLTVFGATVAQAAETSGEDGLLSGTQALLSVEAPVTVSGTAVSLLGDASSTSGGDAPAAASAPAEATTSGTGGIASGTQALISVSVPVDIGGIAVSGIGDAESAAPMQGTPTGAADSAATAPVATTDGADAVASGTQAVAPVSVPVTVDGVAISLIGDSAAEGGATTPTGASAGGTAPAGSTTGDGGIASGTQVIAPIQVPVDLSGLAVSVIGDSTAAGGDGPAATPAAAPPASGVPTTSGADGVLGGTQLVLPVTAPIALGGTSISVIGDATSTAPGAVSPGTGPGTDPGSNPGTDPGSVPGTAPATLPDRAPIARPAGETVVGRAAASGAVAAVLAQTGGTAMALLPMVGVLLTAAGSALLARRRIA